jgi:hypothetical protein
MSISITVSVEEKRNSYEIKQGWFCTIKLFTAVIAAVSQYARVFTTCSWC